MAPKADLTVRKLIWWVEYQLCQSALFDSKLNNYVKVPRMSFGAKNLTSWQKISIDVFNSWSDGFSG